MLSILRTRARVIYRNTGTCHEVRMAFGGLNVNFVVKLHVRCKLFLEDSGDWAPGAGSVGPRCGESDEMLTGSRSSH